MKHLIFDCDGVLVDSEVLAKKVLIDKLAKMGYQVNANEFSRKFAGMREEELTARISEESGIQFPKTFTEELLRDVAIAVKTNLQAVPGMHELVSSIDFPKSVVSNSTLKQVEISLEITHMTEFFGNRHFTFDQVERPKPAPDVYLLALEKLSLTPKDCWAIEDSRAGVMAADAAGIKVIGFLGASHITEGHGDMLLEHGAYSLAQNASELKALLQGLNIPIRETSI